MKKDELLRTAAQYGCEITPGTLRPDIIKAIQAKQQQGGPQPAATVTRTPGNPQLFDELTEKTDSGGSPGTPQADPQRNPPGRRPGVTLEQSRIDNLTTEPNRTVEYVIKWIFKFWAGAVGCTEIALDAEELKEFSVDTTQFLEYHGIIIPQGLAVDGKFIIGGLEKIGSRVMMTKAHKARMKAQQEKAEKEKKDAANV
jgi:hypothetical protein